MRNAMKNFFIITNSYKDQGLRLTKSIQDYIETKGGSCGYLVSRGEEQPDGYVRPEQLPEQLDLIFVVGGDGTLIRAARDTASRNVPLIGVNLGTLGYLCELEEATVYGAIDQIMDDQFVLEARMRLCGIPVQGGKELPQQAALNDIVIHRSGALQLVSLVVYVNGQYLNTFDGDGVIVSTPTGSTGYNMSAGGPIVEPGARLMVMTPICPHTLNTRSIILSPEDQVEIVIAEGRDGQAQQAEVNFDGGQAQILTTGDRIRVHQSEQVVRLLHINKVSFLQMLHKKMGEG